MKLCLLNHDLADETGAGHFGAALLTHLIREDPNLEAVVLTTIGSGHPAERVCLPPGFFAAIRMLPRIRRIFRACDVIHALDGWPYGAIAAVASLGLGKPLLITAIGTGAIQPLYRWYGWLLAWAYRRASRVLAVSAYTRREILKKVPGLEIEVIHHGVEAGEFSGAPWAGVSAEERAKVERWKPYVLSVGAAKERKGYRYSLAAFRELSARFGRLNYLIVGTGRSRYRDLINELGLLEKVIFIKNVSRPMLRALYRNAELFMLLPYDDHKDVEGFGLVFLEAAAAGIPVVGTKESGAEDAVDHGRNGCLVAPRDPSAAARAAGDILALPERSAAYRRGSLKFAGRMSWSRAAGRYAAIYRELVSNTGRIRKRELAQLVKKKSLAR